MRVIWNNEILSICLAGCLSLCCPFSYLIFLYLSLSFFFFSPPFIFSFFYTKNIMLCLFSLFSADLYACQGMKCQLYAECKTNDNGEPACVCEAFRCDEKSGPLCGTDGVTYPNECVLQKTSCANKTNVSVLKRTQCGKCHCNLANDYTFLYTNMAI